MSWTLTKQGMKHTVLSDFDRDEQTQNIPVQAREAIRNLVQTVGSNREMKLETYGHVNADGTGELMVTIGPIA